MRLENPTNSQTTREQIEFIEIFPLFEMFLQCLDKLINYIDYCWREYNGIVPADALPAGTNANGETVYIGHAYMHGYGVFHGTIKPGVTGIAVNCYEYTKADMLIEVSILSSVLSNLTSYTFEEITL